MPAGFLGDRAVSPPLPCPLVSVSADTRAAIEAAPINKGVNNIMLICERVNGVLSSLTHKWRMQMFHTDAWNVPKLSRYVPKSVTKPEHKSSPNIEQLQWVE